MNSTRSSLIWLLGLGAFGLAFSITTTAAYLPPLLAEFTDSQTVIAAVLAAEGLFALTVPLVIGPWSDTFLTPMGRRRPFMLAALWPMGFCLALLAFMPNLLTTAFVVMAFFFAYYVYEPPYRGLYPDLLHESVFARSQGVQHILRGVALGAALVGGGFLLSVWDPAPFMLAAVVTTVACGAVVRWVREDGGESRVYKGIRAYVGMSRDIFLHLPDVRMFLFAMACWEGTFAAMRTFVVLYVVEGLDQSLAVSSTILATVAAGYTCAALLAGPIGDRVGAARVVFWSSVVYATGLLIAGFAQSWQSWYYGIIFPVAVAGGMVMTLSWAILFRLMPPEQRGAISGIATTTKGWALIFGPLVAGLLIDLFEPYLDATDGYQILWPFCALLVLASIPIVARVWKLVEASEPEPALAKGVVPGEGIADHERVHLVGALVREHGLEVVHVPDHRVFERDAVAAEDRPRGAADLERAAHVAHLAHAHLLGPQRALVLHASQVVGDEQPAVDLQRHLCELLLGQLVRGNRLAEDEPALRVVESGLEARPRRADGAPDDPVTRFVEARERAAERRRAGKETLVGHADVVEHELGRHRCSQRKLAVDLGRAEARHVLLDEEAADLAVLGARPYDGDVGDRAVRDPHLRAGEDPV